MKLRNTISFLLVFLVFSHVCDSANILFYFGFSNYSHRIAVWPLVLKLVERGHNVTFLSGHKNKNEDEKFKVTDFNPVMLAEFSKKMENGILSLFKMRQEKALDWSILPPLAVMSCDMVLKSPDTQELIKNTKFDLVVIDGLLNECGLGFAYKSQAPFIYYGTSNLIMWYPDSFGFVQETSWIPDMEAHYPVKMTFFQRVLNTLWTIRWHFIRMSFLDTTEAVVKTGFNLPNMPPLKEYQKNASVFIHNSHYSTDYGRSLPPLYIPVGGMHLKETNKPLSKDLEDFIGDSGFIYISFGTSVKMGDLDEKTQQAFYSVLNQYKPLNFLWKWEGERPKEMPDNVFTKKWISQQDVLAHRNIRGFISHGGLLSFQEAVYHGVPIIMFPIFAEQDYNAEWVRAKGCGIPLEIVGLEGKTLKMAIGDLLHDKRYKENIEKLKRISRDRPQKAVDVAVWWTEFAIRELDTSFLKPLGISQTWFEIRLLDVWFFIFAIGMSVVFLLACLVKRSLQALCATKHAAPPTKQKMKKQ